MPSSILSATQPLLAGMEEAVADITETKKPGSTSGQSFVNKHIVHKILNHREPGGVRNQVGSENQVGSGFQVIKSVFKVSFQRPNLRR